MKFNIFYIICINMTLYAQVNFDAVNWIFDFKKNNISLFVQEDKNLKINYYRACTIIDNHKAEPYFKRVMDFPNFTKIFPKTGFYKKIEELNKNKYITSCRILFTPYKNRDYFVNFEFFCQIKENGLKKYVITWFPLDEETFNKYKNINTDAKIVRFVNGRWVFEELPDNKLYASIEYFNNWEINVPLNILHYFEKINTVEALENIINYVSKNEENLLSIK